MQHQVNEQQRNAIQNIDGPSRIVAGPGSGKTFVIVEKVRKMVEKGTPESSILCMTFTNKAAEEMRQRLEGYGIQDAKVNTFHAFAKELIEDNFTESGVTKSAKIFKKISQIIWFIKNTDKFEIDSDHLDMGGRKHQIDIYEQMLEAIGSFKELIIPSQDLQRHIDSKLKHLQDADNSEQLKQYRLLNEFNKVYAAYEKHCKEKNLIDFDDMVVIAVKILKDEVILKDYLKQLQYILVDEFQDNNYSQMQIVKALGSKANVTVVGDEDQSIMRFQGAYSGIFEDFEETWPDFKKFELNRNYRSTKNIVNLANQLLKDVNYRKEKNLHSDEEDGEQVHVIESPTDKGEVEFVVKKIRSLIGSHVKRRKDDDSPISYKDIAILTRRKAEGQKFAKSLRSFGIPATFLGEFNMFTSPAILDLLAYLKIAESPETAGIETCRILKNHGISEQNILVLANAAYEKASKSHSSSDCVLETVRNYQKYPITQQTEIAEIVSQVDKTMELVGATVSELVYKTMFDISGLYKRHIDSEKPHDKRSIILLNKFYDLAQEFQDTYPEKSLSEFLSDMEIIGDLEVEMDDVAVEESVSVLTMHKSKGKEFPIVFVADMVDGKFPTKLKKTPFSVPPEMSREHDKTEYTEESHIDEERRLLYVAITRAMNMLFLMYPKKHTENVNGKKPSRFLDELNYEQNPLITTIEFEESENFDLESEDEIQREKDRIQKEAIRAISQSQMKSAIHRMVELGRVEHYEKYGNFEGFVPENVLKVDTSDIDTSIKFTGKKQTLVNKETLTLSPSSVKAYEDCPLKFKYQKIMRVPQPPNTAFELGSVIHKVVEDMAQKKTKHEKVTKEECMKKLQESWETKTYLNRTDEGNAKSRAEKMIDTYLEWENGTKNVLVGTEIAFEVEIEGVTFKGRIDRLEKNPDGKLEIIDFKSGKTVKTKKEVKTDPQLNIYAKAIEKLKNETPAKATLFYVEQDTKREYDITQESLKDAMALIKTTINEILDENFEPTPSFQACMFCPYGAICDVKFPGT